ncbi:MULTISPECIES: hypothetical protein [unclassified Massilia]|uniref:hypothetical protein n=1 Tax=unclassified Massilia TaxID=2609279 RepID=UPI0017854064|nr:MULTISPECIES: hypothetical protein [unclassified Massilia]MBD8532018.1 hypothetical protein [Massilia sp. CFBP 13647]MBD8675368.1 hypothetical protein [Massilia sp. CFBP 13721]
MILSCYGRQAQHAPGAGKSLCRAGNATTVPHLQQQAGGRMRELYESTFEVPYPQAAEHPAAWCIGPDIVKAGEAQTAWCTGPTIGKSA